MDTTSATRAPVVLVHGLLADHRSFLFMTRHLRDAGFDRFEVFRYRPFRRGVLEIAESLGRFVEGVLDRSGSERLHVVGHSLGGLMARAYAQLLGGHTSLLSAVGLGAPFRGIPAAHLGLGRIARDLRPRSELFRKLDGARLPPEVRFVTFYGGRDRLAGPPGSVAADSILRSARSTVFDGLGHVGLLLSRGVASAVINELVASEHAEAAERSS